MAYDRNLKVNFFPFHFVLSVIALIVLVTVFSNTVFIYMSSNIYINGLIIVLFIVAMMWIFGVLSYYRKSARVLSVLLSISGKEAIEKPSSKKTYKDTSGSQRRASEIASSIAGTLVDSPAISKALALSTRNGVVELSSFDSQTILEYVDENGERVLGLSKFLTSVFTMLGLAGTFIGLLQTIDGVGKALAALSNIQNVDILGFVKLLADPLQGMAVAFSTSLFGLAAALYGNYGNYVASNCLTTFKFKLKNVLSGSVGIASINHNKIEAKDILIALDDSFNKLYIGLSDRLDVLSESILTMVKGIARTNERQEKVFEVVLDNFESLEVAIDGISSIIDLPDEIDKIYKDSMDDLKGFMSKTIIPLLEDIADDGKSSANSNGIIANNTTDVANVVNDMADVVDGMSNQLVNTSDDMLRAVDTFSALSNDLRDDMSMLRGTFDGFANNTTDIIASFQNSINEVANASVLVDNLDRSINGLINTVSDNTAQAADTLNGVYSLVDQVSNLNVDFNNQINSVFNGISDNLNQMENSVNRLIDSIDNVMGSVADKISALQNDVINGNNALANDTLNGLGNIQDILSNVSNDFSQALQQMYGNNGMENLTNIVANINDVNNNAYEAMVDVLRSLQSQSLDANDRLDVIATVVDALITEILNSRDVTQSILNIVASGNGFTKNN